MDAEQRDATIQKIENVTPATVATWLASLPAGWHARMDSPARCVMAQFFKEYLGTPVQMGIRCVRFDWDHDHFTFAMAPPFVGDYVDLLMVETILVEDARIENADDISAPVARETWDRLDLSNVQLSTGNPQPVDLA